MALYNDYYYEATKTFWPFQYWDNPGSETPYFTDYTKANGWRLYNYLTSRDFSVEAICGILGNAHSESTGLNPGQIENLSIANVVRGGIGFIQWTNTSGTNKIYAANPDHWYDGAYQAKVIADEIDPSTADGSYFQNPSYPQYYLPNAQFMTYAGHDLEFITKTYFYSRERGTWSDARLTYANRWYEILTGEDPPDPGPGPDPGPDPEPTIQTTFLKRRQQYYRKTIQY